MTVTLVATATTLRTSIEAWQSELVHASLVRDQLPPGLVLSGLLDICIDIRRTHHSLPELLRAIYRQARKECETGATRGDRHNPVNFNLDGLLRTVSDSLATL
jgi:hypothetical protein